MAFMTSPRFGYSRGWGWLLAAVWLFYLGQPLGTVLDQPAGVAKFVGLAALVAFAVTYIGAFVWMRSHRLDQREFPPPKAWGWLSRPAGAELPHDPGGRGRLAGHARSTSAAVAMMALPPRIGMAWWWSCSRPPPPCCRRSCPVGSTRAGVVFGVVLAAFAMFGVSRLADHNARLTAAQQRDRPAGGRRGARQVRTRPAQLLGHSLTVITVKAELAGRLMSLTRQGSVRGERHGEAGPGGAGRHTGTVALSRGEARRGAGLCPERAVGGRHRRPGARAPSTRCRAAGATVRLGRAGGGDQRGPAQRGDPAAWSAWGPTRSRSSTTGPVRASPDGGSGHGLRGLRERAAGWGGASRRPGRRGGFVLRVSVPA